MLEPAHLTLSAEGIPWSERYGDIYHSSSGGAEQARHVFLGGNQLPQRWQDKERFVILETGFGLGLNFLTTWAEWKQNPGKCHKLHFVSIEKHPFSKEDLGQAQQTWPEFSALSAELVEKWPVLTPGIHRLYLNQDQVVLTLVFGDITEKLRTLELRADAFYLDGFSPAKNPDMWTKEICWGLARVAAPGASLATWSVSGKLREALAANEFTVEKRPGFAAKKQMLVAHYQSRKPNPYQAPKQRHALVIGAGIAGSSIAYALARRNWHVDVLEKNTGAGQGASGNLAGVFRPLPSVDDNYLARLTRAGFLTAHSHLKHLIASGLPVRWGQTGVLHLSRDETQSHIQSRTVKQLSFPTEFLQYLNHKDASALLGWPVPHGAWYFPTGGWIQPPSLCQANLQALPEQVHTHYNCPIANIVYENAEWCALNDKGEKLAAAPHLIMASGIAAPGFAPFSWLPQQVGRGQTTLLPESAIPSLNMLVCGHGYLTPAIDGLSVGGASFTIDDLDTELRPWEHQENIDKINQMLPGLIPELSLETLAGRVGFRPMSPDRLPMAGPVPDYGTTPTPFKKMRHTPSTPGLWCLQGFGSRGIVWSALMAELLASQMEGEPLPLENDLVKAVSPHRFPKLAPDHSQNKHSEMQG